MAKLKSVLLALIAILIFCQSPFYAASIPSSGGSDELDAVIAHMPLETKIGQMFLYTFPGTQISDEFRNAVQNFHAGGAVLYSSNTNSLTQAVTMTDEMQKLAGNLPLLIAIDQEGGSVVRLPSTTAMPGNLALGTANSKELTYKVSKAIGEEINALGFNVNLAPVLDVLAPDTTWEIGVRSFGTDAELVANMGSSYIQGAKASGILSAAKHFPGHGATSEDSHFSLPVIQSDSKKLRSTDLKPFQAAVKAGVDIIMTAHIAYPALDSTKFKSRKDGREYFLPATLSHKILTDLLRKEMGFQGVIVTDSMQMDAITDYFGPREEAVVMAVKAGADLIMLQTGFTSCYNRLLKAVKDGEIPQSVIDASVKRILQLKKKQGLIAVKNGVLTADSRLQVPLQEKIQKAISTAGNSEHKALEKTAAEKGVKILKNEKGLLPLELEDNKVIVLFAPSNSLLAAAKSGINRIISGRGLKKISFTALSYGYLSKPTSTQLKSIQAADYVLMCTTGRQPTADHSESDLGYNYETSLISSCASAMKPLLAIGTGTPREFDFLPGIQTCISGFGTNECNINAVLDKMLTVKKTNEKVKMYYMN